MWALVLKALAWIVGRFFNQAPPPSPEARASGQAAAANTALATEEKANAEVSKAVSAARASDDLVARDPASLRAPDPDSRD